MCAIFNLAIMINRHSRIDNDSITNLCIGIDHGASTNTYTTAQHSTGRNNCRSMNRIDKLMAVLNKFLCKIEP